MSDPVTTARVAATIEIEAVLARHGLAPTRALYEELRTLPRVPLRPLPLCDVVGHVYRWQGGDESVRHCATCGAAEAPVPAVRA